MHDQAGKNHLVRPAAGAVVVGEAALLYIRLCGLLYYHCCCWCTVRVDTAAINSSGCRSARSAILIRTYIASVHVQSSTVVVVVLVVVSSSSRLYLFRNDCFSILALCNLAMMPSTISARHRAHVFFLADPVEGFLPNGHCPEHYPPGLVAHVLPAVRPAQKGDATFCGESSRSSDFSAALAY